MLFKDATVLAGNSAQAAAEKLETVSGTYLDLSPLYELL
jgi:hypothetical protein